MTSPLLNLLESAVKRANTVKSSTGPIDVVRTLVNSPVVALVVTATPTPVDDLVLGFLKALLPPAPTPAVQPAS